jgi:RNA polymerase sigma-70 factor (ECF subfamily)
METMMADSDVDLVARSKAGDSAALEALYHRYVRMVWRFGWLRTRDRELAAEIVQETFLRVARSIGDFAGRSSFGTWLHAVARSAAIETLRQARRSRDDDSPVVIKLALPAGESASGIEDRDRDAIRDAIADLPPAQRDAVILCDVADFFIREAAETLGWSESCVRIPEPIRPAADGSRLKPSFLACLCGMILEIHDLLSTGPPTAR